MKPQDEGNPAYPAMPGLAKYRRMAAAAGGVMQCEPFARHQYGEAVEHAIRALQRKELLGAIRAGATPNCASGSFANTAAGIESAVRARQARAAATWVRQDREGRSDELVLALYNKAMEAKLNPATQRR